MTIPPDLVNMFKKIKVANIPKKAILQETSNLIYKQNDNLVLLFGYGPRIIYSIFYKERQGIIDYLETHIFNDKNIMSLLSSSSNVFIVGHSFGAYLSVLFTELCQIKGINTKKFIIIGTGYPYDSKLPLFINEVFNANYGKFLTGITDLRFYINVDPENNFDCMLYDSSKKMNLQSKHAHLIENIEPHPIINYFIREGIKVDRHEINKSIQDGIQVQQIKDVEKSIEPNLSSIFAEELTKSNLSIEFVKGSNVCDSLIAQSLIAKPNIKTCFQWHELETYKKNVGRYLINEYSETHT